MFNFAQGQGRRPATGGINRRRHEVSALVNTTSISSPANGGMRLTQRLCKREVLKLPQEVIMKGMPNMGKLMKQAQQL